MLTNEAINKLVEEPVHEEDNYSVLMEEGVDTKELENKLCQDNKGVNWVTGKTIRPISSMSGHCTLWTLLFKLIYIRLIPTTHTSYVTLDLAILLYTMVEKMRVNARWIICNNIIDSIGLTKGLCFLTIITKVYTQSRVLVEKNEEKMKASLVLPRLA